MKNMDIRGKAKQNGIALWKIAEHIGVCEMTLSRKLRHELPQEEKDKLYAIIEELKTERDREVG